VSALALFDAAGQWLDTHVCEPEIRAVLQAQGLDFGRWEDAAAPPVTAPALCASMPFKAPLPALPFVASDRMGSGAGASGSGSDWHFERRRLGREHVLQSAEVLCFEEGYGLLYIRHAQGHIGLLCEAQDWVRLEAGTTFHLLMDASSDVALQRLRTQAGPWDARPSDQRAPELPTLDEFVAQLLTMMGQEED
jgi:hypothetical protein